MNVKKPKQPEMNEVGIDTIIELDDKFPKSKLKEKTLYEWSDDKKIPDKFTSASPITKEQEEYLNNHGIFVREIPDNRTGRVVEIGGHRLKYIDEYHLKYSSATETEARIKFHTDINPELKLMGFKAKTTCKRLFEGNEELNCLDENINAYKENEK